VSFCKAGICIAASLTYITFIWCHKSSASSKVCLPLRAMSNSAYACLETLV